jgi:hypothetical protein
MFNLEKAIAEWRRKMSAAGIKTPVPLDELELHLREDIDELVKSGRSEADAFAMAVQRIGQGPVVLGEFKKITPANDTRSWNAMELSFGLTGTVFPLWICATLLHFKTGAFVDLTPTQQVSGLAALGLFTLFIWSGRLGHKWLPMVPGKRQRGIITACCMVPVMLWWIVFMYVIVPRHDFTMGQFGVTFLWGFVTPAGLMIGLPWGIEAAARKQTTGAVVS